MKGPLNQGKLEKITGVKLDIGKVIETIEFLITQDEIDFEIRTTYVEKLLTPNDIHEIMDFLQSIRFNGNFVLQQYQYSEGVGIEFKEIFSRPEHEILLELLEPYKESELPFKLFLRDHIVGYASLDEL